ncbi:MAG TPA: hypothetical protein VIC63_07990 [Candidatus Limnocylindria bacterium]|jgi:hypothetical protein
MNVIKTIVIALGAVLAALVIVPLTVLAGLFVWLKLTEEVDDEPWEIDDAI